MICPNCFSDIADNSPGCRLCGVDFDTWASGGSQKGTRKASAAGRNTRGAVAEAEDEYQGRRFRPLRWLFALSLVALFGWLAFWGSAPALDRLSAVGTVVFVSAAGGSGEIYAIDPSQRTPLRLTNDPADDRSPSLSSDGRRVAFVSNRDGADAIWVMRADGSGAQKLPLPPGRNTQPLWSPDGRALAFMSDADGSAGPARPEVFVAAADGSGAIDVSQSEATDGQPAWSPGGTRLAFVSDRDGHDRIYTVMADGTALAPLTSGTGPESSPAWSPDGQRVAFVSQGEVFVAALDGAPPRPVTSGASESPRATYAAAVWSPDSARLAAFRMVQRGAAPQLELAILREDGTVEAAAPAEPGGAAWLDPEHIVFIARPSAGRSWVSIQRYSGAPQVCLRSVRRATQAWLRPLDALTASLFGLLLSTPAVDSSLTVLTDTGADALTWAPGSARALD